MKKINIIISIIFILILLTGCITENKITGNLIQNNKEKIKIGIISPLTGNRAEISEYYKKGLELALNEINNNSNNKYKIDIIFEDSQYNSQIGVSSFNKLKEIDHIKYVIGAHGSSTTLAISPIAEKGKIILITPASQSSKISQAGDYVFRTQINTAQEAPFWAKFLAKEITNKELYIIGINTDYTKSYFSDFESVFTENKGKIILLQKFEAKETDFRTILQKIGHNKNILILGTPKHIGYIIKQSKELNFNLSFFATSTTESKELFEIVGNAANGLIYPYPYDDSSQITSMKNYKYKYVKKYKEIPEMISANVYDTIHLLSYCFEKEGKEVNNVKNCLYNIKNYNGASGILSFDKNGDITKPFTIKIIENMKFEKYKE